MSTSKCHRRLNKKIYLLSNVKKYWKMSNHGLLFNKKLIEEVKKCDLIFNVAHPDHPNISITQQTWFVIAATLGDTVQKCRHRWQSLRRRYEREYSRMTSGIETAEYKSNWKYIDAMSFLQVYMDQDQNRFEELSDVSERDLVCRACLGSLVNSSCEQSSERYNIFNTEHLAEKLRQCTNLLIVQWDEYPHSVCKPCHEKVLDFYKFQVMCRRSQEKFSERLAKPTGVKCEMDEEISDNTDCMVDYNDVNCVLTQGDMITENPTTSGDMHLFDAIPENEIKEAYNADPLAACMNEDSVVEENTEVENHQKVEQVLIENLKCNGVIIQMITNDLKSPAEDIADNGTKVDKHELEETSDEEEDEGDDDNESSEHLSDNESSISEDFEASGEKEKPKVIIKCDICPKIFLVQHCLEAHQRRHQGLSGYPCTYANCERAYNRFTDWRRHLNDHNGIPHVFKCDIDNCDKFVSDDFEASGMKGKSPSKVRLKCDICPKTFLLQNSLEAHQRRHQGLSGYPCTYENCERAYNRFTDLRRHLNDHEGIPNVFKCDIDNCDKVYSRYGGLNKHKRKDHKYGKELKKPAQKKQSSKNWICETCGQGLSCPATLKIHRLLHVDKSKWPFACSEKGCTRRFRVLSEFTIHKKRHAGIKNYVCPHCGMRKTTSSELRIHINFHTFERKYPCRICSKVFKSVGTVSTHIHKVHEGKRNPLNNKSNGEKSHACTECGKTFATTTGLTQHLHMHLKGEKPYVCDECGERFKWPGTWKMHVKNHSEKSAHACEECGKRFKWASNLNSHKKLHVEGATPYTCEECGQGFRWPGSYYSHKKKHVGQKIENETLDEEIIDP